MMTAEVLLAAALMTGPQGKAIDVDTAWIAVLRPNILALAMDVEILDLREKGFVLGMDQVGDLAMLQGRYGEFLNAPMLYEADCFPDRKVINAALEMNRTARNKLAQRLGIDLVHSEEIRGVMQELDMRYQIWDAVRDSRCEYYYVTVRRQSLGLLRDLVGHEGFYSGRLPSSVPFLGE